MKTLILLLISLLALPAAFASEQVTDFFYGNAAFPGVVTQQRVWDLSDRQKDLVKNFELDDYGRVKKEIADPYGPHPLITQYPRTEQRKPQL